MEALEKDVIQYLNSELIEITYHGYRGEGLENDVWLITYVPDDLALGESHSLIEAVRQAVEKRKMSNL